MNKRKGLIFGGALLASAAVLCTFAVGSRGGVFDRGVSVLETRAVDLNTLDFEMRLEGSAFEFTKSYTQDGLVLDVTDGDKTDFHFGIAKWGFPTPKGEDADYYCEFVLTTNVAGWKAGGAAGSEIVLEAGKGDHVYEKNFSAGTEFTISKQFKAKGNETNIILSLGALRNAEGNNVFNVKIKKFILKEGNNTGSIVNRINFETASGFANRWRTAHVGTAFCDAQSNVEELIYDYSALREPERRVLAGDAAPLSGANVIDGTDAGETGLVATVGVNAEGAYRGACIEVTTACKDNWRARMFINTGITMTEGKTYAVAYNAVHSTSNDYDFWFNWRQWDDHYTVSDGKIAVGAGQGGELWIQVQMGAHVDKLALNDICVTIQEKDVDEKFSVDESVKYFAARYDIELN